MAAINPGVGGASPLPNAINIEKNGLLSGLPPPSHITDGSPLVEHDANRLQEAMTWVYNSVWALQEQRSTMESRLAKVQEMLLGNADAHIATQNQLASLSSRIIKLEEQSLATHQKVDEVAHHRVVDQRRATVDLERVQKDMNALVRYVGGSEDAPQQEDIARNNTKAKGSGANPMEWLEKRIEAMIAKQKGLSIEERMSSLEKAGNSDVGNRVKKIEQDFRLLDVKDGLAGSASDLGRVRPDLRDYQHHQEAVALDLNREIKELKVIVGCVEACIPRETRKAVALFKREAGTSDGQEPSSPREFAMEGKILALKEEMVGQMQNATAELQNGRTHMTAIVKGLERKQEILESRLEDVRRIATPQAAPPQGAADVTFLGAQAAAPNAGGP